MTIKELPADIRPRERLINNGPSHLSDSELLAIMLGTGTRDRTAIRLAEKLIAQFKDITALSSVRHKQLMAINGIGEAKAAKVIAAFELGRRAVNRHMPRRSPVSCPEDIWKLLGPSMRLLDKEHFKAVFLDTKHNIIAVDDISIGSLNASIVHPRELYKEAIKNNSSAVIVVHNHPSGNTTPSCDDIDLTRRLANAGEIIGIRLVDHIVIGSNGYLSLKEKGLLN